MQYTYLDGKPNASVIFASPVLQTTGRKHVRTCEKVLPDLQKSECIPNGNLNRGTDYSKMIKIL